MANVQNSIFAQRQKTQLKKKKKKESKEITEERKKKKEKSVLLFRESTRPVTAAIGFLPSVAFILKKTFSKMLFTGLGPSILEETVPSVWSTRDLEHSFFQYAPPSR